MQVSVVLTEEEVKPEVHLHKQEPQACSIWSEICINA